ncbi:MAG: 4'-phosphopantetheinyl transferase superfamily protein [Polyangiaceae bacterium]
MPSEFLGSIAHTRGLSIAIAARPDLVDGVGIDIERATPARPRLERRILTASEQSTIGSLPPLTRWTATLSLFCAKEAAFKALDARVNVDLTFKKLEANPAVGALQCLQVVGSSTTAIVAVSRDAELVIAVAAFRRRAR